MSKSVSGFLYGKALLALLLICIVSLAPGVSAGSIAPVNPEFTGFINTHATGLPTASVETFTNGHPLGLIPSPIIRDVVDVPGKMDSAVTINATFDLRSVGGGRVTSVKDQGDFGTCWAHATFGSLESNYRPSVTLDFSEKNLANKVGFDVSVPDGGGNMYMSTASLTGWNGPVNEASDRYITTVWTASPSFSPVRHVQNVVFFPARTTATDNTRIKTAIMTSGAVYSSFYWHSSYYNTTSKAYNQPYSVAADPAGGGGHAVTIIGWNDNYPRTNFRNVPGGNGAWLVKNSWGTAWGNAGYFWISYYDKYFASRYHASAEAAGNTKDTGQFLGEAATNYNGIYSYDTFGDVNDYYYDTAKTGTYANVYTATSAAKIAAVGFYTTDINVPVTIRVYKSPVAGNPMSGTLAATATSTQANMGYHTIALPAAVPITAGQKFAVVATVTNPTNDYFVPFEYNVAGYTSGVYSYPGQGYIRTASSSWVDFHNEMRGYSNYGHIALKAYTVAA